MGTPSAQLSLPQPQPESCSALSQTQTGAQQTQVTHKPLLSRLYKNIFPSCLNMFVVKCRCLIHHCLFLLTIQLYKCPPVFMLGFLYLKYFFLSFFFISLGTQELSLPCLSPFFFHSFCLHAACSCMT